MNEMETLLKLTTAEFLGTKDVAKWQAVDVATRKAFDLEGDNNVWKNCAEYQYPQLIADVALYQGELRQQFLMCHALLLRANCASDCVLFIDDIEHAKCLASKLRNAAFACEAHLMSSSRDAHVLLGGFFLRRPSRAAVFDCGVNGKSSIAGLPAGILRVKLFLNGDSLMTCAEYGFGRGSDFQQCVRARDVRLTLSVTSFDCGLLMTYRSVPLILDGRWRSSTQGMWQTKGRHGVEKSVLCILSLMEGEPLNPGPSVAAAMHLEPSNAASNPGRAARM
eukprot:TRINITY_DN7986_c0_g2_i1.p1 TRINITY_DN7986_c0_g2~~TRINITY_DN7986_c0_g2_i1.p1  ORF type:complete len:279 (+),score=33.14 TRINITY_DN7986_c0_g2_i1:66-902(+)